MHRRTVRKSALSHLRRRVAQPPYRPARPALTAHASTSAHASALCDEGVDSAVPQRNQSAQNGPNNAARRVPPGFGGEPPGWHAQHSLHAAVNAAHSPACVYKAQGAAQPLERHGGAARKEVEPRPLPHKRQSLEREPFSRFAATRPSWIKIWAHFGKKLGLFHVKQAPLLQTKI
jgi:hypothetical protein